ARGPWYLVVCADTTRRVVERNERNNCRIALGRAWLAPPPPVPPTPPPPPPPPPNHAPTDIALSNASVAENQSAGTEVGALSTTDADAGDTFIYSLVSGVGSTDNGKFEISGNQLQTKQPLDFEADPSLSVRIQTSDGHGGTFEKAFTIS